PGPPGERPRRDTQRTRRRRPAPAPRRALPEAAVRSRGAGADPPARGGQALPVRNPPRLPGRAVAGLEAELGAAGRCVQRRRGRGLRPAAARGRRGDAAAVGRRGQGGRHEDAHLRRLPAAAGALRFPMNTRPWWIAQALAQEGQAPAPALEQDTRAGLCVVGGGFTGLWTAILSKQARPELDVVVLEADVCGAGASGRNGGCVLTWSTKFFTLLRLFGEAEAVRLVRASEQAILDIEAFCQRHAIACEFRRHGTLYTASAPAQVGASDAVMAALQSRGISTWSKLAVD